MEQMGFPQNADLDKIIQPGSVLKPNRNGEPCQTGVRVDRNKKILLIAGIIFLLIMLVIGIDISKRTTFPGQKGNVQERIDP